MKYTLAQRMEPYGSALTVHFPNQLQKEETTDVTVEYETTDACTAVQWLNPEQTFGGKYPFMYLSRWWIGIDLGFRNARQYMRGQCYLVKIHHPSKRHGKRRLDLPCESLLLANNSLRTPTLIIL